MKILKSFFLNLYTDKKILGILFVVLSILLANINAQTICIPRSVGVPFQSGSPKWFESPVPAGATSIIDRIDDPRWKLCSSLTHGGSGAIEDALFRALYDDDGIYLSWWTKFSEISGSTLLLYTGLSMGPGTSQILLIKVTVSDISIANSNSNANRQVELFTVDDATGYISSAISPAGSWIDSVHVWVDNPNNTWAVNIYLPRYIDLGNGVTINTDYNMWYEIFQEFPGGTLDTYTWPRSIDFVMTHVDTVPDPNGWLPFHLSLGSSDPDCASGGITIEPMDIGTMHPDGSNIISKTNPNEFFARPTNLSGDPIETGRINARFRLANWGTQPDKWDIPDATEELWKDIPGLSAVVQSPPPATIGDTESWDIRGIWTLTPAEQATFDGVQRWDHQCILVELSGVDVHFLRSSVHRNMRFVPASTFKEEAQINITGLPPFSEGNYKRDVYLYVQTLNMPEKVTDNKNFNKNETDEKINTKSVQKADSNKSDETRITGEIIEKYIERSQAEKLAQTEPTYIVRAFYDAGKKIKINETEYTIIRPMTAYGYFVQHEGSLAGWKHSLEGAEEIAPNFYKITVDSTAIVTSTIIAVEAGFPWWWIIIIILIILIIIVIRIIKK
jgi:hypothetical protein